MTLDGIKFAKPPKYKARGIPVYDPMGPDSRVNYWSPFRSFVHANQRSESAKDRGSCRSRKLLRREHRRKMRARKLRRGW